jgi:hypothetical protein
LLPPAHWPAEAAVIFALASRWPQWEDSEVNVATHGMGGTCQVLSLLKRHEPIDAFILG